MEQINAKLCEMFPGREQQIETLLSLMGEPQEQTLPAIYVYGDHSLGKTTVIKSLMKLALPPHQYTFIDCIVCFEPRIMYQHVLNDLTQTKPTPTNKYKSQKCANLKEFVVKVGECCQLGKDAGETRYLIFDQAERLRDKSPDTLLPTLMKLRELDTLKIFSKHCPNNIDLDFFLSFVRFLYDVCNSNCKDLCEMFQLAFSLLPKYIEPVVKGRAKKGDTLTLIQHIEPYYRQAMDKLHLNEISSSQNAQTDDGIDLPYYTKLLLIASFLASYNPSRLDKRYFSKGSEETLRPYRRKTNQSQQGSPKKSPAKNSQYDASGGGKLRQQLLGPVAFPVERMLAIFDSIIPDSIDANVEIMKQVSTLVTLRLLTRTTPFDNLDSTKYKCNASYELVKKISSSIKFQIQHYLYDFE
ncbi:10581_t:CDS:2 [Ambispora gerdemannii]|uniref:10581_t:CDS:1 n=1 Tax=Ambispora gerdemannii TaxID=144530 RepID=A0A9N9F6A4_9GLOM|nr:10581_t:CDS:2 [Ambispora gerdemannii]